MTKAKKFNNYLLEKCLIGNGIINGILNAIIFYTLEKGTPGELPPPKSPTALLEEASYI